MLALANCADAAESVIYSGGYRGGSDHVGWRERLGTFGGDTTTLFALTSRPVLSAQPMQHSEAQLAGALGADFSYSADVTIQSGTDVSLQFRISDEGRYGISVRTDGVTFYRFSREAKQCDSDPRVFPHCRLWPSPRERRTTEPVHPDACRVRVDEITVVDQCDDPQFQVISRHVALLAANSQHRIVVEASGRTFRVLLDGTLILTVSDRTHVIGRFGVYVLGPDPAAIRAAMFRNVRITVDPASQSNFALLYSTAGYDLAGTKRALIRTLHDLAPGTLVAGQSRFALIDHNGRMVASGPVHAPGAAANPGPVKTFGMQLWEADFSTVSAEGNYVLSVDMATVEGIRTLRSQPFQIRSHLVTTHILKPLTILNTAARRSADDDMRRNWIRVSGNWSVGVDGAFIADRADAAGGALLERVFNGANFPLNETDFRIVGQITIVQGCDAQVQFRITTTDRWAVTLQAGSGGQCTSGGGPGAVRLHREAPGVFQVSSAVLFPADRPFKAGEPYDVEILVSGTTASVTITATDRSTVQLRATNVTAPESGTRSGFGIKAWNGSARFAGFQAWGKDVLLTKAPDGYTRISHYSSKQSPSVVTTCQEFPNREPRDLKERDLACNPYFSQLHGLHDANNVIGEATSHGTFLAGLMDVWTKRAQAFSAEHREDLRRAILTNVLYIEKLFQVGAGTGEFVHSEIGRGGINTNLGSHNSLPALYGLSAFADRGIFVDTALSRQACDRSSRGAHWMRTRNFLGNPAEQSVIYARIARCVQLHRLGDATPYWDAALAAAEQVLSKFIAPAGFGLEPRDTGRVIPWFEGVQEILESRSLLPSQFAPRLDSLAEARRLNGIADILVGHLTAEHACSNMVPQGLSCPGIMLPAGPRCPANGYFVLPQASGDSCLAWANWTAMELVPLASRPTTLPYLHFYEMNHYATAASDTAILARLAGGRRDLERIASANLYWTLGLNPGVPAPKRILAGGSNEPWLAASFLYGLNAASTRLFQAYRTKPSSAKGWRADWEINTDSPRRETWWVDPLPNGFQTIVNGHTLWDGQWDYWNSGEHGWSSGETFIRNDGAFVKAALLIEDWLSPIGSPTTNPYPTNVLTFFDTSHVDRSGTGWLFDDPDHVASAHASRGATNFCNSKQFIGGRFTGHFIGERIGLLCVSTAARFFDATVEQIRATNWDFADINTTHWAQVARAATGFCATRGFVGGFFTGHQLNNLRGVDCVGADSARWFDSTPQELASSGHGFTDINTVAWAQAARAATNICLSKGFAGGFFTGHQVNGLRGVVCLSSVALSASAVRDVPEPASAAPPLPPPGSSPRPTPPPEKPDDPTDVLRSLSR